jgi:hypothetical protein
VHQAFPCRYRSYGIKDVLVQTGIAERGDHRMFQIEELLGSGAKAGDQLGVIQQMGVDQL